MLDELKQFMEEAGRDPASIDISFGTGARGNPGDDSFDPDVTLAAGEELAALGVTWSGCGVPGTRWPTHSSPSSGSGRP